jgi:hypothetical protein
MQIFHFTGEYIGQVGSLGDQPGMFNNPTSVAAGDAGGLYIADKGNKRIQIFRVMTRN